MGLNDAQEMLDAAKAQTILDERRIAALEAELAALEHEYVARGDRFAAIRRLAATATTTVGGHEVVEVWRLEQILDEPGGS
jgi:hypothetical protein